LTNPSPPGLWQRIKDFYLMPFRAIAAGGRLFGRNRRRIREFTRRPQLAEILKYGMLITLLTWLAVAMLNKEEDNRLTEATKQLWSVPEGSEKGTGSRRD